MASTYSTNLAIELIGTGDQAGSWGNTTNTNLGTLIEQAISGYVTQAVSTGTDTTITIPNGATGVARNMYIELTGTGGTNTNLIVPANKKLYFIFNNTTGAVTVKVSGQTGVSVPQGKKMVLTSNGTDTVNALNYIADFGSNSATITQLTATSATITNLTLTSLVISNLSIASANVTTLTSASATITNLLATSLTVSSDAYINSVRVGRGSGNISTNTAVGASALAANTSGTQSVAVGNNALAAQTTGFNNIAIGHNAGDATTTGASNIAIGVNANGSNISGGSNVAVGTAALSANTADSNVAVGSSALTANSSGANNLAVGHQALQANTTASSNTAIGYQAAYSNQTGTGLTSLGFQAGYQTTGSYNTAVGLSAGYNVTSGTWNTFLGVNAGPNSGSASTGSYNTAIGGAALQANTTASNNTAVGYNAGYTNTTAADNTFVGHNSGYYVNGARNSSLGRGALSAGGSVAVTGTDNSAVGYFSLVNNSGSYNTALGSEALRSNTTGTNNVAMGYTTLYSNTTASYNQAFGARALYSNTTGTGNIALGYEALVTNTTGDANIVIGGLYAGNSNAAMLSNTTGSLNVAISSGALAGNTTGGGNIAVGYLTLAANTTASFNTALGRESLRNNTTGGNSTAVGYKAGYNNTTGQIVSLGYESGYSNTTGIQSTFIGYQAGYNTTGSANTFVGGGTSAAAGYYVTTGSKNTILGGYTGNQGGLDIRTASNYIVLSDGDGNPRQIIDGSGNLGLGVTPSAWGSNYKAIQLPSGTYGGGSFLTDNGSPNIAANAYNNGTNWKYVNNDFATIYQSRSGQHQWLTAASGTAGNNISFTTAMLLDASGNLGVGTTSPSEKLEVAGAIKLTAGNLSVAPSTGTNAAVTICTNTGGTFFAGLDSSTGGTFGKGNYTSVLYNGANTPMVFFTNATERARITSGGNLLVGKTADDLTTNGAVIRSTGLSAFSVNQDTVLVVDRTGNDGTLVSLRQDNAEEGSISVSGNTVSYNAFAGSHWSQLQDGSKPDILRGTVMESINELCVWPGENNERLPKSKISDTVGSKKVYGVFMAWDNDWSETNDMYVTAVGAFICRVNGSVTVQEGDLLESNGDGTARVQADDIIRSSTIGKVTSTVKTHEYDDGSYCVPTVLYCG